MTLLAGFMIALSAEIGLRIGLLGSFMSMITTWACSPTFSLMQMNLSDSIVRVLNPMFAGLMPRFWSWKRRKGLTLGYYCGIGTNSFCDCHRKYQTLPFFWWQNSQTCTTHSVAQFQLSPAGFLERHLQLNHWESILWAPWHGLKHTELAILDLQLQASLSPALLPELILCLWQLSLFQA